MDFSPSYLSVKPKYIPKHVSYYVRDMTVQMVVRSVERVPRHILGANVLGRCWGYGEIQIADDLEGEDYEEVHVHEQKHANSPWMSEGAVRFWTQALLPWARYQ